MRKKKKQFDVVTLFPEIVEPYVGASILGRAQKAKLIVVKAHNLRDWTTDKHKTVDDTPYGGGAGMVMKVEPFEKAVQTIKGGRVVNVLKKKKTRVIVTAASGKTFTQQDARRLVQYDHLIFLCGRYEGIDHRVTEHLADEALSIGDYVLTGGELPAMVMIDAIARMVPGVIEAESLASESHTQEGFLEYPQYTKPEDYKGWKVPDILLSGDHKKIAQWRKVQAKKKYPPSFS
ncbi:tRNA (guanosine(37)-N1)-methyltransferase TrmD [Patescibacteria group bacterium]|nr:MAG: tRNA (guanosine(37)-N1)-methyltransferase TrmD [Patescibacteria group bacterium]